MRSTQILDTPPFAGRREENRAFRPCADRLIEHLIEFLADRDPAGFSRLAGCLVLAQNDHPGRSIDVGDRRPAEFTGAGNALPQGETAGVTPMCATGFVSPFQGGAN